MATANHHFNIRIDTQTASAIKAQARIERKSIAEFARDALRARLEIGAMIEPIRVAVADAGAVSASQVRAAANDAVHQILNAGESERERIRSMIADFIDGLQSVMGAKPSTAKSADIQTKPIR